MKMILNVELKEKTTVSAIRQQFNIPTDLVAKDDQDEILSDDTEIINDDNIRFCKPEMINILLHLDNDEDDEYVKILEGSTISQLIEQIKDTISLPENFNVHELDNPKKLLNLDYLLQNGEEIEIIEI